MFESERFVCFLFLIKVLKKDYYSQHQFICGQLGNALITEISAWQPIIKAYIDLTFVLHH